MTMRVPHVDIVVPVRNEERDLALSVRRLVAYLRESFPFGAQVTIADNGSTDATWAIADGLARELPEVRAVHMELPGRGRALRAIWSQSEAEVLAYMDVDLSTDLNALLPLVAPLLSGHSDLAIGTRLARGSRVIRGPKRELISRGYNLLLRTLMGARFSDAQCGFKAIRRDQARALLPLTRDTGCPKRAVPRAGAPLRPRLPGDCAARWPRRPDALDSGFHCVRTHWIRGFMTFRRRDRG